MPRFIPNATLVALLASSSSTTQAFTIELAATGQFAVQGSTTYRSIEPPVTFLVQPSPFGRPVLITSGPLAARLLDPKRVNRAPADPEVIRVDTSRWRENFLPLHLQRPT